MIVLAYDHRGYELFKNIARETQLGFATNCGDTLDERYMYCDFTSYKDLLDEEIRLAKSDETHIYDWWVDLWNNVNFVNIYERYNTIDPEEDMQIWVSGQPKTLIEGVTVEPHQVSAILNNLPSDGQLELKVDNYEIINKPGSQMSQGSDKVYSIYMEDLYEYKDTLIQDGDTKKDIFEHYEYLGEVYGEYNYLLAEVCRDAYLQKMGTESIKITLKTPLLALMRGHKVDFVWYINDAQYETRKTNFKNLGIINENIQTTPVLDDTVEGENLNDLYKEFTKDETISGQYMITAQDMTYENGQWYYELILNRPLSHKPKLINEELK